MKSLQEKVSDLANYSILLNSLSIRDFLYALKDENSKEEYLKISKKSTHGKLTKRKLAEMLSENFQNEIFLHEEEEYYVFFLFNSAEYLKNK